MNTKTITITLEQFEDTVVKLGREKNMCREVCEGCNVTESFVLDLVIDSTGKCSDFWPIPRAR